MFCGHAYLLCQVSCCKVGRSYSGTCVASGHGEDAGLSDRGALCNPSRQVHTSRARGLYLSDLMLPRFATCLPFRPHFGVTANTTCSRGIHVASVYRALSILLRLALVKLTFATERASRDPIIVAILSAVQEAQISQKAVYKRAHDAAVCGFANSASRADTTQRCCSGPQTFVCLSLPFCLRPKSALSEKVICPSVPPAALWRSRSVWGATLVCGGSQRSWFENRENLHSKIGTAPPRRIQHICT